MCEWYSFSPYSDITPKFELEHKNEDIVLKMTSISPVYTFGKWCRYITDVVPKQVYKFSVRYMKTGDCDVRAMLVWFDADNNRLNSDYANLSRKVDGLYLTREIDPPGNASSVRIELMMSCKGNGGAIFYDVQLIKDGPYAPRLVTLATTHFMVSRGRTLEQNLLDICRVIGQAAKAKPDIIVLTENAYDMLVTDLSREERAITIPGNIFNKIADMAKSHGTYLVLSVLEKENGYFYNTAVLIDRNGQLVGKYRKTHLPLCELEEGVVPGDEMPVFETDFGKVGLLICWDHWFPEAVRIMQLKGAEIVCVPTMGFIDYQGRSRAMDNGVYLITSYGGLRNAPEQSRIIDRGGEVIAQVEKDYAAVTVDLNRRHYERYRSVPDGWGETRSLFETERRPDIYGLLCKNDDEYI